MLIEHGSDCMHDYVVPDMNRSEHGLTGVSSTHTQLVQGLKRDAGGPVTPESAALQATNFIHKLGGLPPLHNNMVAAVSPSYNNTNQIVPTATVGSMQAASGHAVSGAVGGLSPEAHLTPSQLGELELARTRAARAAAGRRQQLKRQRGADAQAKAPASEQSKRASRRSAAAGVAAVTAAVTALQSEDVEDSEEEEDAGSAGNDTIKDARKLKRLLRNRVSAQQARERKKQQVAALEEQLKTAQDRAAQMEHALRDSQAQNDALRRIIRNMNSGGGDPLVPGAAPTSPAPAAPAPNAGGLLGRGSWQGAGGVSAPPPPTGTLPAAAPPRSAGTAPQVKPPAAAAAAAANHLPQRLSAFANGGTAQGVQPAFNNPVFNLVPLQGGGGRGQMAFSTGSGLARAPLGDSYEDRKLSIGQAGSMGLDMLLGSMQPRPFSPEASLQLGSLPLQSPEGIFAGDLAQQLNGEGSGTSPHPYPPANLASNAGTNVNSSANFNQAPMSMSRLPAAGGDGLSGDVSAVGGGAGRDGGMTALDRGSSGLVNNPMGAAGAATGMGGSQSPGFLAQRSMQLGCGPSGRIASPEDANLMNLDLSLMEGEDEEDGLVVPQAPPLAALQGFSPGAPAHHDLLERRGSSGSQGSLSLQHSC